MHSMCGSQMFLFPFYSQFILWDFSQSLVRTDKDFTQYLIIPPQPLSLYLAFFLPPSFFSLNFPPLPCSFFFRPSLLDSVLSSSTSFSSLIPWFPDWFYCSLPHPLIIFFCSQPPSCHFFLIFILLPIFKRPKFESKLLLDANRGLE